MFLTNGYPYHVRFSLLRREITTLRRIVFPLRRTVLDLTKDAQRFSKEDLTPYFRDVQDHIEKVYETLEEAKETVEIYKDTDFMLSTEKTNKILAVLTIVFTLSIPATVIGTFYGMNINIPGGIITGPWGRAWALYHLDIHSNIISDVYPADGILL